jgi:hypothetical protein
MIMKSFNVLFIFVFLTILFPFQNPASAQIPQIDATAAVQYFREANAYAAATTASCGAFPCAPQCFWLTRKRARLSPIKPTKKAS